MTTAFSSLDTLAVASASYDAYVYQLHCSKFPEDYQFALQSFDATPAFIESEVERIANQSTSSLTESLKRQLQFTTSLGQRALGIPRADTLYGMHENQIARLSDFLILVGNTAMQSIQTDPLYSANSKIYELNNPFTDMDLLSKLIVNKADKRQPIHKKKYFNLNRLAPGYFS